jgi:nitrogen fixation-related uncharacterized protein
MKLSIALCLLAAASALAGCAAHPQFVWDKHSQEFDDIAVKTENLLLNAKEKNVVEGVEVFVKNQAEETVVIEWAKSSIAVGTYSTVPFLGGMRHDRAGDPQKLPETPIAPGSVISQKIFFSQVESWGEDEDDYRIIGATFQEDIPQVLVLTLSLRTGNQPSKYYVLKKSLRYAKAEE